MTCTHDCTQGRTCTCTEPANNWDATVFVFRSKKTGEVRCVYKETWKNYANNLEWRHMDTLEPRLWIQAHYNEISKV